MVSSPQPSCPQKLQRETGRTRKSFYASSVAEHFEGKIWQKPDLFDSGAVSEILLVSFRNILRGVVNTAFHMSREKLWDKSVFFFKKKVSLTFFSDLEWRKYGFVAEVFHRSVKNKIHVTRRIFGKTLFGRTYNFISFDGFCEENLICKKTQGSSVRHSTGPVEQSRGQNSGETKPF